MSHDAATTDAPATPAVAGSEAVSAALDELAAILDRNGRPGRAAQLRADARRVAVEHEAAFDDVRRLFTDEPRLLGVELADPADRRAYEDAALRLHDHLAAATAPAAPAPPGEVPGRTLGIVGFVLSLVGGLSLVGLILSWVALAQSRRAGHRNRLAVAGVVIGGAGVLLAIVVLAVSIPTLAGVVETCRELGPGVHEVGNATYTCTPTSAHVTVHS
ncbi:DUF4190 domain-containing protein [Agromyces sp. NPDC057865]|uniref:DUF4190 domain-containing protein n=1 Tax=Agromyces sp. NPDC057865 TaxID=3346267 RepID=UPI00366B4573